MGGMKNVQRIGAFLTILVVICMLAAGAAAQSPNTATIVVNVIDQSGSVIPDAQVSVTNNATGAVRETVSGNDGSATVPGLPLTGSYTVAVSKSGFGNEQLKDINLRSGETAT